ncbi:MAG: efflux RND transporter periplasmic adaptor subunit [Thermodesulfobacteriota bacterium]
MTPVARSKGWWGLGVVLVLIVVAGLHFSGVLPWPFGKEKPKPLCYVSPKDPNYIKEAPGKDPEGHELVPVYPTGTPGQPPPPAVGALTPKKEGAAKYWRCPMHPEIVKETPGKCPKCGMDLVPVQDQAAPAPVAPKKERKIKYWVSPMDPGYVRDKPGKAPCGMDLVPVYEEVGEETPGTIKVSPATIQSMGVRTTKVEVRPLSRVTLTVGTVTFDERNLNVITTKVDGWVERLYVNATGDPVRKGQTLLSIYSPELVSAQEEYLLAVRNLKAMKGSPVKEMAEGAQRLADAARRRLSYFDITSAQINELERTGQIKKNLMLFSPVNGIVTKRMATQGMYVKAGLPALEVADLSTIWVDADIYQYELPWIKAGQPVTMTLDYLPGETFQGKIDYLYPYLKEATRTAKVRLRFPNPQLKLKPEMFAQVKIESPVTHNAVVVPADAVIDTGLKQHVFIALGQGRFEPREVKLGVLGNDGLREVLAGLKGGEEVVTSAQFMLDSESRFREAVQLMMGGPEMGGKKEGETPAMPGMKLEGSPPAAPTPPAMPPGHKH